jgi:hypothetical protein
MRNIPLLIGNKFRQIKMGAGVLLFLVLCSAVPSPAKAQDNLHTWMSNSGVTTSPCGSFETPCKYFSTAVNETAAGGEIECKDAIDASFGPPITKSLTFTCDVAPTASAFTNGSYNLSINVGVGDVVVIRGLNFDSGRKTYPSSSYPGIDFTGAGRLVLDKVKVTGYVTGGVLFEPNGPAQLEISNSLFSTNGTLTGGAGAGIRIWPQAGGTARVHLDNVTVVDNAFGVAVDGSASTNGINVTIANSLLNGNANDGLVATTSAGKSPVGVFISNTRSTNNLYGVRSIGSNLTVRMRNSEIIGNSTGISASNGGALLSQGNNTVEANAVNGSFTGSFSLK